MQKHTVCLSKEGVVAVQILDVAKKKTRVSTTRMETFERHRLLLTTEEKLQISTATRVPSPRRDGPIPKKKRDVRREQRTMNV